MSLLLFCLSCLILVVELDGMRCEEMLGASLDWLGWVVGDLGLNNPIATCGEGLVL